MSISVIIIIIIRVCPGLLDAIHITQYWDFLFATASKTGSRVHPASYLVGTGAVSPGDKMVVT
jgi:hypothetical protein